MTTARAVRSKRYRVIDLSSLFCEPRACYPVIGGVQVYADIVGHITQAYMKTVGPYLLRRLAADGVARSYGIRARTRLL